MNEAEPKSRGRFGRVVLALGFVLTAAGAVAASQYGYVDRVRDRVWGRPARLSAGDFPAGVAAPDDDVAAIPVRATVIGMVPRGSVGPLLWAAGDSERIGLFRAAYALDVKVQLFDKEDELRAAFVKGGENGGVDLVAISVSTLAMMAGPLRDAAPRTVLLLGRSRGQDLVVGSSIITHPGALSGKRLGTEPRSTSHYLALWAMSRAGLSLRDVTLVPLSSAFEAGAALKAKKVDAVAGYLGDLDPAVKEIGGTVVATTADAPHLIATVLVSRGDFAARYPDAIRRLIRGVLDANAQASKDPSDVVRTLGRAAPQLGDPTDAMRSAPPASLKDNLGFFGLEGEAPVTYVESYQSAAALQLKLGASTTTPPSADDTADLGPLRYVASAKGP